MSGWIKPGPFRRDRDSKKDARDTVDKILESAAGRPNEPVSDDVESMIACERRACCHARPARKKWRLSEPPRHETPSPNAGTEERPLISLYATAIDPTQDRRIAWQAGLGA